MFVANKPQPPPHLMQVHRNRIRAHQHHLNNEPGVRLPAGQPIRPNLIPLSHVLPTPNIPNANGPASLNMPTPHIPVPSTGDMHKYVLNNVAGGGNDIIEIQRIPEVFSTGKIP